MKDKDLIYMYAVQEKKTGKILSKSSGGKFYERSADAAKKVERLGDGYQVVTYRLLELGPKVTPDTSVTKQKCGRRTSECPIDNWVRFQCGTIV
jgi:hypothetical protein